MNEEIENIENEEQPKRSRAWRRKQNSKRIAKSRRILKDCLWLDPSKADGKLRKGKIHCSCPCCTPKTNDKSFGWKHSDKRNMERG